MCVIFSEISVENVEKIDKLLSRFVFNFFLNSECRDKCTQRGINERYLHVDNSLT